MSATSRVAQTTEPHTAVSAMDGTGGIEGMESIEPRTELSPINVEDPQSNNSDIEVDSEWYGSDYEPSVNSSFMTSISSKITEYSYENGRRYHAYCAGRYPVPNDEQELDREEVKHLMMMVTTEFRLHLAPLGGNPQRILDLGTGTGTWAVQMAELYPSAAVIGTDLSPVQPQYVPPNLNFEIDDVEQEWLYKPGTYDFIHCRFMLLSIKDFPQMLRQAYRTLRPGGYIELTEIDMLLYSHGSGFPANSYQLRWFELLHQAARLMGYDMGVGRKFKSLLEEAGFDDVTETRTPLAWGNWPKDKRLSAIGALNLENLKMGLQGLSMALFTRFLGWSPEEVELFLVDLRREMDDKSILVCDHTTICYGRKPL